MAGCAPQGAEPGQRGWMTSSQSWLSHGRKHHTSDLIGALLNLASQDAHHSFEDNSFPWERDSWAPLKAHGAAVGVCPDTPQRSESLLSEYISSYLACWR